MLIGPWNRVGMNSLKAPLVTLVNFPSSCSEFLKGSLLSTPAWNTKGQDDDFRLALYTD